MILRLQRLLLSSSQRRTYSSILSITGSNSSSSSVGASKLVSPSYLETFTADVRNINSRLENLSLMGKYLSGKPLLELPSERSPKNVECPTTKSVEIKKFIVEKPIAVKEPEVIKKVISNPLKHRIVKKHAIRLLTLRHKKMKKHQLKRLWDRMYLKFRAERISREKQKELEFRGRLSVKVADARKFDAEKYVDEYLNDYHTPLIPKTYNGSKVSIRN